MEFKIVSKDEEIRAFDSFLAQTSNGHFMQSSFWGNVKSPTWTPLRVVVQDKEKIIAAAQILKRTLPFIPLSIFYLPRGPVLNDYTDLHLFSFLLTQLIKLARSHRAIFIKIDPCIAADRHEIKRFLVKNGFRPTEEEHSFGGLQPKYTFRLKIDAAEEDIFNAFPKKIRYKIRYGPRKGVEFRRRGAEGLDGFFSVMQKTADRSGFVEREAEYYAKVFRILHSADMAALITGHYEGKVICASMTFAFGNKAWAAYGAQGDEYRNLYAYHAMIWERIKWAKEKGAQIFDFFGVPGEVDKEHPLYGIYHFKKSFGGDFQEFIGEYDLPINRPLYYVWKRLIPRLRRLLLKVKKFFRKKTRR
ncbi:MAG: lipid II:glycine glycyltransferase FemX [Dethiobacteria bacterium]|nr:peptidoglycan bridge formation glycyltransferase FemA/FemB family protein [Bacillota bacterium]